jgi:hypothetical protein
MKKNSFFKPFVGSPDFIKAIVIIIFVISFSLLISLIFCNPMKEGFKRNKKSKKKGTATATDGTATDGTDGTATDGTATDGTATDGTATTGDDDVEQDDE